MELGNLVKIHFGKTGRRCHVYGFDKWHSIWPRKGERWWTYQIWYWAWFEIHCTVSYDD